MVNFSKETWNKLSRRTQRDFLDARFEYKRSGIDEVIGYNAELANAIQAKAEDGEIAIVWSGIDCDSVCYRNDWRILPAIVPVIRRSIDERYYWADGPCNWVIKSPSEVRNTRYVSRDLALEAFEDGHAHVVHY